MKYKIKKNRLKVAIIAAFGLLAGHTAYSSQKDEAALSNITLDNVEALASESGSTSPCYGYGSVLCPYNNIGVYSQG